MAEQDRIAQVFQDRTIFITGGTGFLGKTLIEKFLRCCEVKRLYLLVRKKKGKTPDERLEDIFSNVLFDLLKSQKPSSFKKCVIIPGDISEDNLGISPANLQILQNEVDFIYHSAASTRFDDSVKTAVTLNTKSTKSLLDLAESCKNLKVFVHVSTAYAFPQQDFLQEKPYPPPADPHKVLAQIQTEKEEDIEKLLGDCPNTYTFSKALAESFVVERMDKIPALIVRPSVVCPTWLEPLKGWCNNLQGPMGLFVGAGKGIIRSMYMEADFLADFIPADITINGMLIAVWNYLNNTKKDRIINFTSSSDFTLSWEELIETGKSIIYNEIPFNGAVWYPGGSIKKSRWVHNVCFYLFQLVPAIFLDAVLMVLGYKPILYQIQKRIQKGSELFEYYTNRPWNFSNSKSKEVRERMNDKEKQCHKIDGEGLDVREYLKQCILCVRKNNLKEPDETLPAARRHMNIMWAANLICELLLAWAILYYFYQLVFKPIFRA